MRCGVGCRPGLDLMLLWLWRRPVAAASIRLLAWEPPHATVVALKKKKEKEKKYIYNAEGVPIMAHWVKNRALSYLCEDAVSIPGLAQWVKDPVLLHATA